MDPDLFLVIGIIVGVLTVPTVISALSEGRAPRATAVMLLIAGVLIALALNGKSGGYTISEIPDAFGRVFNRYIN